MVGTLYFSCVIFALRKVFTLPVASTHSEAVLISPFLDSTKILLRTRIIYSKLSTFLINSNSFMSQNPLSASIVPEFAPSFTHQDLLIFCQSHSKYPFES